MKKVSIIIPVFNVDRERFRHTLDSLVNQTVQDFEVCISDGYPRRHISGIVEQYRQVLSIQYVKASHNLGISDNTNAALALAQGDYVAFLDHDDLLAPTAIEDSLAKLSEDYDVVYSDEDIVQEGYEPIKKTYKPDYSPDLLETQNYICHFLVIKKEIIQQVGQFNSKYDGAQDYDYILRVSEVTSRIGHIPKILYHWLATDSSTATNKNAKPYAQDAGFQALNAHLKRVYGSKAEAVPTKLPFVYRPVFHNLKKQTIDIIIPMKDKWSMTQACIDSILQKTQYPHYHITIINNRSEDSLTLSWLKDIPTRDSRIRVIDADFDFNWSKLQNLGIKHSHDDAFVFLNNDTIIMDGNWLDILLDQALRPEIGVVGPLLLYEDGTIQHAGVVVGLGGYADHLYKGEDANHTNMDFMFISPMVQRDVLAVTGACMAISRDTLHHIGYFDENFIICGSDVEICLRAYEHGLRNLYTPNTVLVHLESKSRSTYIPPIDFYLSKLFYHKYWEQGDPYYNNSLDYAQLTPQEKTTHSTDPRPQSPTFRQTVQRLPLVMPVYQKTRSVLAKVPAVSKLYHHLHRSSASTTTPSLNRSLPTADYIIPEVLPIVPLQDTISHHKPRINLLIPSLNKKDVFGGIATALQFFDQFDNKEYDKRIIVTDRQVSATDLTERYSEYKIIDNHLPSEASYQVIDLSQKSHRPLVVSPDDIFIASAWWTAYIIAPVIQWQITKYHLSVSPSLIYFIQDYEPYFYNWSSYYCLAESTYHLNIPTTAVFNSQELQTYFKKHHYTFTQQYHFDPVLHPSLKQHLLEDSELPRKKQVIVYGRPSTQRNAFEIIVASLRAAFADRDDAMEWTLLSMGEEHPSVHIKGDTYLVSVGKLSLDQYAKVMAESYLGISLMVSPHPSYPPLEMSSFGVKTITNRYANKDLTHFNDNIISVERCDVDLISQQLTHYLDHYAEYSVKAQKSLNQTYLNASDQLQAIVRQIQKSLGGTNETK